MLAIVASAHPVASRLSRHDVGVSEPSERQPPPLLPGPSAGAWYLRGYKLLMVDGPLILLMIPLSFLPQPQRGELIGIDLIVGMPFVIAAGYAFIMSSRVSKLELAHGYSTLLMRRANQYWQLDRYTGAVLQAPIANDQRPPGD